MLLGTLANTLVLMRRSRNNLEDLWACRFVQTKEKNEGVRFLRYVALITWKFIQKLPKVIILCDLSTEAIYVTNVDHFQHMDLAMKF